MFTKLNANAYKFNCAKAEDFNKICSPLNSINIDWFAYTQIYPNGKYLFLNNDHNHLKDFYSSIRTIDPFFMKVLIQNSPEKQYSSLYFSDINETQKKQAHTIMNLYNEHNISNVAYIYRNIDNKYIESYIFGMKENKSATKSFYINNQSLLLRFIDYFQESSHYILNNIDKTDLAHLEQSYDFHKKSYHQIKTEEVIQFLQKTQVEKRLIQGKSDKVLLAKGEIKCLDYLALGYGMKGVAEILGLSPRTVESYINNAKLKTGYPTKQLLLTQFIKDFGHRQL